MTSRKHQMTSPNLHLNGPRGGVFMESSQPSQVDVVQLNIMPSWRFCEFGLSTKKCQNLGIYLLTYLLRRFILSHPRCLFSNSVTFS